MDDGQFQVFDGMIDLHMYLTVMFINQK